MRRTREHDSQVVGIAFQNLMDAENIGFVIPVPVIVHMLCDIETHGKYRGFPKLGVRVQVSGRMGGWVGLWVVVVVVVVVDYSYSCAGVAYERMAQASY